MPTLVPVPPRVAPLYCCMFIAPDDHERVQGFLLGAAINGLTEDIRYRLWTLETGALCLAIPVDQRMSRHSPEHRPAGCFCPIAPRAVNHEMLNHVQKHAALIRHLARARDIILPDDVLFHVSDLPGEVILSLKCESDGPPWDQSVQLVRQVKNTDWAWQGYALSEKQTTTLKTYPKFAWKEVAPPMPALLAASRAQQEDFFPVAQQEDVQPC